MNAEVSVPFNDLDVRAGHVSIILVCYDTYRGSIFLDIAFSVL